ncbi:MAG: hypothetical protein RIF33_10395 [Cyclobacteriaceae bacterium]
MKVLNIHERIIHQPFEKVAPLLLTLATKNDAVWPKEQWPSMRFRDGLTEGAEGGHGPIRYTVVHYDPPHSATFRFSKPKGFDGTHTLAIEEVASESTKLKHTIDMKTTGAATLSWALAIRWLHDALIEDAFDKLENQLTGLNKRTPWSLWVRTLRKVLN